MASLGTWATAWLGVGTASLINNLPAARAAAQPGRGRSPPPVTDRAGSGARNLVVTGSLSAIFWMRVARSEQAQPSARTYSRVGASLSRFPSLWLFSP